MAGSPPAPLEVEYKYVVPDRRTFKRLRALRMLGSYALRPAPHQKLVDHYFDTDAHDLQQAGYSLRLRQGAGRQWLGTLKRLDAADGASHQREEYEVEVPPHALPAEWPASPARDLALRLSVEHPLHELFAIRQRRLKREVRDPTGGQPGQVIAELSLDEVRMAVNDREQRALELELELADGAHPDVLDALHEPLALFGLEPQPLSKFQRGLALLETAAALNKPASKAKLKPPDVRGDQPMAEVGRFLLHLSYKKMVAHESGARTGADIEEVHDMRATVRRQRAAFSLFADFFKPKVIQRFRKELKQLADRLGAVRDLDVQLAAARAFQTHAAAPVAAGLEPALAAWEAERDDARAKLVKHLDSSAYRRFKRSYKKFVKTPGAGLPRRDPDPAAPDYRRAPTRVREILPARLWDSYGAVRAYAPLLPDAPVATLHALRIAGKGLRYNLEFFAGPLGPGIQPAIAAVTALQDHLGELHDADVTLARLAESLKARHPRPAPATVEALKRYRLAQQKRLEHLCRTAGRPWRAVAGARFRQALGQAVARL